MRLTEKEPHLSGSHLRDDTLDRLAVGSAFKVDEDDIGEDLERLVAHQTLRRNVRQITGIGAVCRQRIEEEEEEGEAKGEEERSETGEGVGGE